MSREIKFRAKHTYTGDWIYGSSFVTVAQTGDVLPLSTFWVEIKNGTLDWKTVRQYTGLKDKNGKEIYEGDIVSFPLSTYGGFRWKEMKRSVVIWDEIHSGYAVAHAHDEDPMSFIQPENVVEVIGNIYENKELLDE